MLNDTKLIPSKSIKTVIYPEVADLISNMKIDPFALDMNTYNRIDLLKNNEMSWRAWLTEIDNCKIEGLDEFPFFAPLGGTSQALYRTFNRQRQKGKNRLIMFPGEYTIYYHNVRRLNLECIEIYNIDDVEKNCNDKTFAVLALPETKNGMFNQSYIDSILDILEQHNIPTFLDLALYGTYNKGIIHAKRKNVCGIFSGIGKGFGVWHLRSSVYFSRNFDDIRIFGEEANAACFNTLTTEITNRLLNNFPCTYFPLKYKTEQLEVCKFYDLLPSDCIHLAISETKESQQHLSSIMKDNFYTRPHTNIYRVGIGDLISFLIYKKQNRKLPFYLKNDYEYIDSLDYYDWNCNV